MASARAGEEQISRRSSTYCGFDLLVDFVEDAYVLRVWPEADLAGKTQTPCHDLLFRTTEDSPLLDQPLCKIVHSIKVKILFIANRGCPD